MEALFALDFLWDMCCVGLKKPWSLGQMKVNPSILVVDLFIAYLYEAFQKVMRSFWF